MDKMLLCLGENSILFIKMRFWSWVKFSLAVSRVVFGCEGALTQWGRWRRRRARDLIRLGTLLTWPGYAARTSSSASTSMPSPWWRWRRLGQTGGPLRGWTRSSRRSCSSSTPSSPLILTTALPSPLSPNPHLGYSRFLSFHPLLRLKVSVFFF